MLWNNFSKQYAPYITLEVADAVVISILMHAMERGLIIEISRNSYDKNRKALY